MLFEALGRVVGLGREVFLVGSEEVADLDPELLGLAVESQIHQLFSRNCGLTTLPPGLRGSTSRNSTDRGVLKFAKCSRV